MNVTEGDTKKMRMKEICVEEKNECG